MNQTLLVVCGWPMSGKTSVACRLKQMTGWHYVDADDVLVMLFGAPNPTPVTPEEIALDGARVARTYQALIHGAGLYLEMGKSLIISAPFSRAVGWKNLQEMLARHPGVSLKVIWCHPSNVTGGELSRRLGGRVFGKNCWSSVNTAERYHSGQVRYEPVPVPCFDLDTSPPNTPEDSARAALVYVQS